MLLIPVLVSAWLAALSPAPPTAFVDAVAQAVSSPDTYLEGTTPNSPIMTHGNRLVRLLDGTPAVIAETCAMIASAQHELLLQIYEWEDGDASAQAVQAALKERIERAALTPTADLHIRLIIDNTWPALSAKHRADLEAFINGLDQDALTRRQVYVELAYFDGFGVGILHSKTVIRDATEALVMTGNFKTAGGLATDFYNTGVLFTGDAVRTVRDDWLSARRLSQVRCARGAVFAQDGMPTLNNTQPGDLVAAVLTRRANHKLHEHDGNNPQNRALLALIGTTQARIDALNPALNVSSIVDAVQQAILDRGVVVRLVLSLNMDRRFQRTFAGGDNADTAYRMYKTLLQRGGKDAADKLHIVWASADGHSIATAADAANVHAKVTRFDDACLWVGSMNWDKQSWNYSRELSIAFFGDAVATAWGADVFERLYAKAAPMAAADVPQLHRHRHNAVFDYLASRVTAQRLGSW